ncbi:MAG: alpha/beta fold hydrolase, partial [Phormidesmis sp.]
LRLHMRFNQVLQQFVLHYAERWPDAIAQASQSNGRSVLTVLSPSQLRDKAGNYPKILHHSKVTDHAVVLVHGLTDSPYYMQAIAEDFARAGFNVVLPLLPGHGLKRPGPAFRSLRHTDWIATVDHAVETAHRLGRRVSIGGLSTGGALSVRKAIKDLGSITGGLFLYSAALDIGTAEQLLLQTEAGRMIGRLKDQRLWLTKTFKDKVEMILNDQHVGDRTDNYGIGENDYKYSVFFYEGVSQLAEVIQEINQQYDDSHSKFGDLAQPVFAAHSKTDDQALFKGVQRLIDNHPNKAAALFAMENVPHASVVLKTAIIDNPDSEEYAPANPEYKKMSQAMLSFAQSYLFK